MGRPTKPIVLKVEERSKLQEWARRPKTAQRLAMRARIVLGCADGKENRQVARELRITDQTVCKGGSDFAKMAWKDWPTNPDLVHRVRFPTLKSKL